MQNYPEHAMEMCRTVRISQSSHVGDGAKCSSPYSLACLATLTVRNFTLKFQLLLKRSLIIPEASTTMAE